MSDVRDDEAGADDADRLPWLEAVEDEDERGGPSGGKVAGLVIVGLLLIGVLVGGFYWLGGGDTPSASGGPELIAAPKDDYKVKPEEPGGMQVEGEGDSAFAASEGVEVKGQIDVASVAETPVAKTAPAPAAPPSAPKQAPAPKILEAAPMPDLISAPAAGGGATIQLGAFSSQAAASAAWKAMSGRFSYLAPLTHSITPVTSGGRTLYRLRASGEGATDVCGRLRVAGEQCVVL